jgi:hypothetical protein
MSMPASIKVADRIEVLNDNFRTSFQGGRVVMTQGVAELPLDIKARLILAVQSFNTFNRDNDPHREHDFGEIALGGETYFWKIDAYAPDLRSGVEDARMNTEAKPKE